jgi:hypothetical protein
MFAFKHMRKLPDLKHFASRHLFGNHLKESFSDFSGKTGLVKLLRERSGAPISEVKAALEEAGWDVGALLPALGRSLCWGAIYILLWASTLEPFHDCHSG